MLPANREVDEVDLVHRVADREVEPVGLRAVVDEVVVACLIALVEGTDAEGDAVNREVGIAELDLILPA